MIRDISTIEAIKAQGNDAFQKVRQRLCLDIDDVHSFKKTDTVALGSCWECPLTDAWLMPDANIMFSLSHSISFHYIYCVHSIILINY
jgi:hypothetical protein